jgi:hypothetical protein
MLLPLARRKTSWVAYCDACLVGSPAITFDVRIPAIVIAQIGPS